MRRLMDAWADGLNYFLATHPERAPARAHAVRAVDGAELHRRQHRRRYRADRSEAARGLLFGQADRRGGADAALASNRAGLERHRHRAEDHRERQRAAADQPAHQLLLPLRAADDAATRGSNVYGAATWGQFFIYQGFNPHAGWMHTSSGVDNVDEFAEKVERRGSGSCYRYGAACRPLASGRSRSAIRTADGTPRARAASRPTARITGPIVRAANGRWIAFAMMNKPVEALAAELPAHQGDRPRLASCRSPSSRPTAPTTPCSPTTRARSRISIRNSCRVATTASITRKPVDGSDPATDWRACTR